MTLTKFLTARLDADQEWAHNVLADPSSDLHGIARRTLREVEAKRKILARHHPMQRPEGWSQVCWFDNRAWPCSDVKIMAAVYSDHPDYRQDWA